MAHDYALERYAFGRAIGSYQAIKHKLADMLRQERARPLQRLLRRLGADRRRRRAAAGGRGGADRGDRGLLVRVKENIQTHGGIGFTWEVDSHLYYRRARQLALALGGPMAWKDRLVSHLEQKNAA